MNAPMTIAPAITGAVSKNAAALEARRISPSDTNYFVPLADPFEEGVPFTILVEIYERGGATPPNTHDVAYEFFYILKGEGIGICDGAEVPLSAGSTILIPPGKEHIVKNTGDGKLYALCVMIPNEGFAELIRGGSTVALDAEDKRVLAGLA